MLEITPEISRMLRKGIEGEEIVDYAIRTQGMMTLAEAAARKLCRGMISSDHVQHLLISTHRAAPEEETHAWQTKLRRRTSSERKPIVKHRPDNNSESDTVFGDVIDVEFTVPPQAPHSIYSARDSRWILDD